MTVHSATVFDETMTPEMIKASDLRAQTLLQGYETLQQLGGARLASVDLQFAGEPVETE